MKILALVLPCALSTAACAAPIATTPATTPPTQTPASTSAKAPASTPVKTSPATPVKTPASSTSSTPAPSTPAPAHSYDDLMRAGETAFKLKDFAAAMQNYDAARALKTITNEQKARAQFGYASSRHQDARVTNKPLTLVPQVQADYEAALRFPELPVDLQIQAHEAISDLLLLQNKQLLAAREVQKILALPNAKSETLQKFYLNRALDILQKAPSGADTFALGDEVFKTLLPLQKTPAEAAQTKLNWAQLLSVYNQTPRALALWNEVAADNALPLETRADAVRKIAAFYRAAKNWTEALSAADRLSTLPGATPHLAALRSWERAAAYLAQNSEPRARLQWQEVIAAPQISPEDKALAWIEIGNSYRREHIAKADDATTLESAGRAYETAWKLEAAPLRVRTAAMLGRAQLELDAKNLSGASTLLQDALKTVEPMQDKTGEANTARRSFQLALATIDRGEQNYSGALAALIVAQHNSAPSDTAAEQSAIALSQQAFAAQKWDDARAILLALQETWGMSHKTYLVNLAQVEIAAKNWTGAKKALDELATLNPTPKEKAEMDAARAKIPAG